MVKFLHAADLHLDSPLIGLDRYEGAPVDEVRLATRHALRKLVSLAQQEKVDFVLLAGDIYDGSWKDYNTGLFFTECMRQLTESGIQVFLISGNHDAQNKMTRSLRLPPGVTSFDTRKPETVRLEDAGVAIHGFSFADAEVSKNVSLDFPAAEKGMLNIGILHTSLDGDTQSGHKRYAPCSIEDLRTREYDYWALGHIHQRAIRKEEPHIVFPGNLQGRHIRETGAKGCMLVEASGSNITRCEFRPLDVMRWEMITLDGSAIADEEQLYEQAQQKVRALFQQHDKMPLALRLVVTGACPAHAALSKRWGYHREELKSVATGASSGLVWLEKTVLQTELPRDERPAVISDGALAELADLVLEFSASDTSMSQVLELLRDLQRKLPSELVERQEGLDLSNSEQGKRLLMGAHDLLKEQLQRGTSS